MRWAIAVILVALAACGRSDDDVYNAVMAERNKANEVIAAERTKARTEQEERDCAARATSAVVENRAAMQRARETIMTTLGAVSGSSDEEGGARAIQFGVRIESLEPAGWSWVEAEIQAAASDGNVGARRDRINYSVNPATLSPTVDLVDYSGLPSVRFRCNSGNCIRAIGHRIVHYNGQETVQPVDEQRAENVWALDTTNRAEVVRNALAELIRRTATPPPRTDACGSTSMSGNSM